MLIFLKKNIIYDIFGILELLFSIEQHPRETLQINTLLLKI
jgi:hypothetical protein